MRTWRVRTRKGGTQTRFWTSMSRALMRTVMSMVSNLNDQLIRDEGVNLKVYVDSMGHLTIGIGRNLDAEGISIDEARFMLNNDIVKATAAVTAELPWTKDLDDVRFAVLVNMVFNMGIAGLMGFVNMLSNLKAGNYSAAADDMLRSKWSDQVGDRALRLSRQLRTGIWQ